MFPNLSDEELLEVYKKAVEMKLEKEFIAILKNELECKGLSVRDQTN